MPLPEDIVSAGLARRIDQDLSKSNLEKLLRIALEPFQELENVLQGLLDILPLADANTWVLDSIYGPLVDLPRRAGWSNDTFRFFIATKIQAYKSSGLAPELMALARRFVPTGQPITDTRFFPQYPAGYRMEIPNVDPSLIDLAAEVLSIATTAGVRGILVFYQEAAPPLEFQAPGASQGWGRGVFATSREIFGNML